MDQETKKKKLKKQRLKGLLIALGVGAVLCGVIPCIFTTLLPSTELPPTSTWAPVPTLTATLEPTEARPIPTKTLEDVPSLRDIQWFKEMKICLDEQYVKSAMLTLGAASSAEPFDVVEFCTSAKLLKVAVVMDQSCLDEVYIPEHPLLQESHMLHSQALETYDIAANLLLDFCTTGEIECLNLAHVAIADGNLLIGQAADALNLYNLAQ